MRAGEEIVGWGLLMGLEGEDVTFGIGVADAWCGRGYGRVLMERCLQEARDLGKRAVLLIHVEENIPAGTLYRKLGFVETGEHVGADGNAYWEMRLDL
jgi:GNAT superfamily N-acetyltransferase